MKPEDIEVEVIYTEGYQQRFTAACLRQLRLREKRAEQENKELQEATPA